MVRRRTGHNAHETCSDSAEDFGWGPRLPGLSRFSGGGKGMISGGGSDAGSDGRLAAWFTELGKAIGDSVSQTVQKVKEAANQPALAKPMNSFSAAATAVLNSGPAGTRKGRGGLVGRSGLPADVPLPLSRKVNGVKDD